jgi:2-iminobutanoate/2-iminopropanoate deaminase
MKAIETENAPSPGGHYSQGVTHGGFLFVSGQLPIDPATGEKKTGPIEEQTRQTLDNVLAIVRAAGGDKANVVKTTVFVSDIALWSRVNDVYAEFFGDHRPARAVVPVTELHHGFLIEIEAVAAIGQDQSKP